MDSNEMKLMKAWERRKFVFVLQYISCNILLSYFVITISDYPVVRNYVIWISMCLVAFLLIFRLVPSVLYLLVYKCRRWFGKKITSREAIENRRNGEMILDALKNIEIRIKELEKREVKKKKEDEYNRAMSMASQMISKKLNNYGNKLRSRVTQHMINHNIFANKEAGLQNKTNRRKKIHLKKKLKPVEEASIEES